MANPLQSSRLEKATDRGHRVTKGWTRLSTHAPGLWRVLITAGLDPLDAKSRLPAPQVKTKQVSRHCITSRVGQSHPWVKTSLFTEGWQKPEEVRQERQQQLMVKMAKTR